MTKIVMMLIVNLVAISPAFAAASDVRSACESDVKALCAGVQPGGGRIKSCMQEHKDQLSSACKDALAQHAKDKS